MLGRDLAPLLRDRGHEILAWGREDCDVCDAAAVSALIGETCPDLIIHAAAYTQVDRAESELDLAMRVNGEGTRNVAAACRDCGIPMFYLSTDYVFDGTKRKPYVPEDPPNPLNVYGRSKLAGEQAVQALCDDYCIVRTSWLYGRHGQNFVSTILRLARERSELQVVNDQIGAPTWTATLADALADLIDRRARGIYHVTDACEGISWYDFAAAIVKEAGCDVGVRPIRTADAPRPAARPHYSVLDRTHTETLLGRRLPFWRAALSQMLAGIGDRTVPAP